MNSSNNHNYNRSVNVIQGVDSLDSYLESRNEDVTPSVQTIEDGDK